MESGILRVQSALKEGVGCAWMDLGMFLVQGGCQVGAAARSAISRLSDMRHYWMGLGYPRCLELLCHELCNTDHVRR